MSNIYFHWKDNKIDKNGMGYPIRNEKALNSLKEIMNYLEDENNNVLLLTPTKKNKKDIMPFNLNYSKGTFNVLTNNLVGVVNYTPKTGNDDETGLRIEIGSRFDKSKKQNFLLYMICKAHDIRIYEDNKNLYENYSSWIILLIIVFGKRLLEAFSQGLYKKYKQFNYNLYDFKGAFNVVEHINKNTPFTGKTAYRTREHTYDNEVLCLIRQTIDYLEINHSDIWSSIVRSNPSEYYEIIDVLREATPSYSISKSYQFEVESRREISHPFFYKYEPLRQVSIGILMNEGINIYNNEEESVSGVLFDVAWLWEEFVGKELLVDTCEHISWENNNGLEYFCEKKKKWYPDFLTKEDQGKPRDVYDAKYKKWDYENDDMHQLLSYLYITGGSNCGAVFPQEGSLNNNENEHEDIKRYENTKAKCWKLPFDVSYSDSLNEDFSNYTKTMDKRVIQWRKKFKK